LEVLNTPPSIAGPEGFEAVEGTVIYLNVKISDSIYDELYLNYSWEFDGMYFNDKKPSLWLDNGDYNCTLMVTDPEGLSSELNISLKIFNVLPVIIPVNKIYYGEINEVELEAYAVDSFVDINDLRYNWSVDTTKLEDGIGTYSSVTWIPEGTKIYDCAVTVQDDTVESFTKHFQLATTYDRDGDGLTDEYEAILGISPDKTDTDNDTLTDWYEIYEYGTDPLSWDTDMDGLPDGCGKVQNITGTILILGEIYVGTNPLSNDTDNDNLTDGFEVHGWIANISYNDEVVPRSVSSDPLLADTDGDNLTDYEEFLFNTDPRVEDSDGDGKNDYQEWMEETQGSKSDSDGDKLSDYQEDQSYPVYLKNGTVIMTYSNKTARDSDNDGLDDWEERNPGRDGFITDAMNNDTDGDGLIDSAESYTAKKIYENGMRKKIERNKWNTFSFKTAIGSRITNATVTVTISQGEPVEKEDGTTENEEPTDIEIEVYVQGHLLYTNSTEKVRYYSNLTDITKIMEKHGWSYKGEWKLKVYTTMDCVLEEFKIEASIILDPLDSDSDNDEILDGEEMVPGEDGWITSPALADTDGDTLSDYYEIHCKNTCPVSADTDGDHARDNIDKDPLHNLIIKITVYKAHYENAYWSSPLLCAVFEVNDNSQKIATPYRWASESVRQRSLCLLWVYNFWTGQWVCISEPKWYVNTTSVFNVNYYVDVPDYLTYIKVNVELWKITCPLLAIGEKNLDINVYHRLLDYENRYNSMDYMAEGYSNWIKFRISTMGLPRVNTIAVYQNGSFYNGHYSSIERMNLIILKVNGQNDIFERGLNVIVLPTSLFAKTKLHAIIENAVKDGEIDIDLLPDCLKPANFSGIDRGSDSISPYIESIITRDDVPLADAMEILELCITSANESEGLIYNYTEVIPELAGLAPDVLGMIPFEGSLMRNSDQGKVPRTWLEAFVQFWQDVIKLLYNVLVAIVNFIMYLIQTLIEWGLALIGIFQEAAKAIEAAVKAIILVLAYVLLAITLFEMIILWTMIGLIFIPLMNLLISGTLTWFTLFGLRYEPENGKTPIIYEESIKWIYFPLLDLNLPVIQTETRNGTKLISKERRSVIPFLNVPKDENNPVSTTSQSNSENEDQKKLIEGENLQNGIENEFKSITYSNLEVNPDPVVYPNPTTISIEIEDTENIEQVNITIDGIENSMTESEVDNRWEYTFYPINFGIFEFTQRNYLMRCLKSLLLDLR